MAGPKSLTKRIRKRRRSRRGILPLRAYYGHDPEQEAKRATFYARMARHHDWVDWRKPAPEPEKPSGPGHGGRGRDLRKNIRTSMLVINTNCAPLEHMSEKNMLHDHKTEDQGIAMARFQAGLRIRSLFEGAALSPVASPDLERVGSGGKGAPITDTKVDCMKYLDRIKQRCRPAGDLFGLAEPAAFPLMEQLCGHDFWVWEYWPLTKRPRRLRIIHYGLDCVAAEVGELSDQDFNQRWHRV